MMNNEMNQTESTEMLPLAAEINPDAFFACDLRVGTILSCELNPKARKPAYKIQLDFGRLGPRTSSAQLTGLYTPEQLIGRQVIAVLNFPPRNVAGVQESVPDPRRGYTRRRGVVGGGAAVGQRLACVLERLSRLANSLGRGVDAKRCCDVDPCTRPPL